MEIKNYADAEPRRIDVKEWNAEVEIYFRSLDAIESIVFNDLFIEYRNAGTDYERRFAAIFKAAKMTLVQKDGAPLLTDADYETIKKASFAPLFRLWQYGLNPDFEDESFKKK